MPPTLIPRGPLYMTPPSKPSILEHQREGRLGLITTPAQGNQMEPGAWWCADNGVFGDAYPGDTAFLAWLEKLTPYAETCLFVVAPDVVGSHAGTWARSRDMLARIRSLGLPVAYVAQNGMEYDHSCAMWDSFEALFLGGSTDWKVGPHAAELARAAHDMGKWVHMGRVNSLRRYLYTHLVCRADSVDGTYLTKAPDKLLPTLLGWVQVAEIPSIGVREAEITRQVRTAANPQKHLTLF